VQPVYMHPYTVAKMVTSMASLYGRRIYLNMVAGGFKNDLTALNDTTPHDLRYERLVEYTTIIKKLLSSPASVTFEGKFYKVENLTLKPSLPKELFPGIFVSGSSEAGLTAARAIGATAVKYPEPPGECAPQQTRDDTTYGGRIGIIARDEDDSAWEAAYERFPEDRRGQITHQLVMKVSDSVWHQQLSRVREGTGEKRDPYWLIPFQNYKTFCPYLVGSHKRVAEEVSRYIAAGCKAFILDIPPGKEELDHTSVVFEQATRTATAEALHP
jgi:alkanesulfonate monooxygenase